jgi:tetratricopeptide (TPR) repeat protein
MIVTAAVAVVCFGAAAGCASALDDARAAWADGEGDFDEAERLYKEAMKNPKVDDLAKDELLEIYLVEGDSASKKGKYKKAEDTFRAALELDPSNEDATAGLARALREMYKFDEALAVARKGMDGGQCRRCRRLVAVLLIRRGDALMEEGRWAEAESDYLETQKIIPDAGVALAIVRARYAQRNLDAAAKGLREAVNLVGVGDSVARRTYLDLQRAVVLLALEEGKPDLADELLDLAPAGTGADEQIAVAMEVAVEFGKQGKPDVGLSRLMALVDLVGQGKIAITPEKLEDMRDKVATLHAARAALRLADGDIAGAQKDLDEAVGMRPDDPSFKLQRILIVAGQGQVDKARGDLEKINKSSNGYNHVSAILYALEVDRLVTAGNLDAAKAELGKAKSAAKDLPEVHIANAQCLAASSPTTLSKGEEKELKSKDALVKYPGRKIVRAGEALAELDWSRQQIKGLGTTYPYRAPGTDKRLDSLEDRLKGFFPFPVKFHADPEAIIVLQNKSEAEVEVEITRGDSKRKRKVPAAGTKEIEVKRPGLVVLEYGGKTAKLLTEPYTQLEVPL